MATDYGKEKAELYAEEMVLDALSLKPMILDMLKGVKAKTALDFGCGNGRFSKAMAGLGMKVIGIDVSQYQIDLANRTNQHQNVEYIVGDGDTLNRFDSDSFDLILMNMIFPSFDGARVALDSVGELPRILRRDGRLIISTLHPSYLHPIQGVNDRATDFKFENYFKEGHLYSSEALTTTGKKMQFRETHFSIEFISSLLANNRFCIRKIRESRQVSEKNSYVPVYIAFECAKI